MNDAPRWVRSSSLVVAIAVLMAIPTARAQAARGGARTTAAVRPRPMTNLGARSMMAPRQSGGYYNRGYNRNAMASQNNGPVIQNLHSTMALLARADHDYQGHRVRAMHQIGTAIRHLEPPAVKRNQPNPALAYMANGNGNGAGAGGKNLMPQAASDAHLRNALQNLNTLQSHLANYGSTPNHVRAHTSVQNAIRELNVALNIK